jgi:hypothetical protein
VSVCACADKDGGVISEWREKGVRGGGGVRPEGEPDT